MISDNIKGCLFIFTLGAGFGTITLTLSSASQALFGIPLGFAQLSIKNFLKCSALSGTTLCGLMLIDEELEFLDKLKELIK